MTPNEPDQRRPVVGIAATVRTIDLPYVSLEAHTVFDRFVRRVADAGGVPVLLPVLDATAACAVVAAVDALLLTGGVDLQPELYGGEPVAQPMGGPYDIARDRFEIALTGAARAAGTPILGVCRGMHILNVAAGGTLVGDIEDHIDLDVRHRVTVAPTSTLTRIVGSSVDTGSLHHQAVGRVGEGLRIVATAPDGVAEAIEATDGAPVLGVQWHPEMEGDAAGDPLWRWLVRTAGAGR
jgi:putative glutamine amidotransferase